MNQKGRIITMIDNGFVPQAERVLMTSVCRDVYHDTPDLTRPSSITSDGFQDGFGEYSTHLPDQYKFFTRQPDYGLSFLEHNVKGPRYLQYPRSVDLEKQLASGNFDVIGVSAYTWSLPWAIDLAQRAKRDYGFKEAWLGGYAVMTDEPKINQVFDRVFWGYSESNLNTALGRRPLPVESILHPDLTTKAYFLGRESTVGHILFRRGCPNSCTYCADPVFQPGGEGNLSFDNIDNILKHYHKKGIRSIYFSNQDTDLLGSTGERIVDSMYGKDMRFGMLTSFSALNRKGSDGIKSLYDKGLNFLLLGLESLNELNLQKTRRKAKYKEMYSVLKLLQKMNVIITTTYMLCFEDDTPQSIRDAKKMMIEELGVNVSLFNITMPLPGTPMYREYKDRGLIFDWNWTHWNGNYLIWQHPTRSKEEAMELLAEMRSEVNSPVYNPNTARL